MMDKSGSESVYFYVTFKEVLILVLLWILLYLEPVSIGTLKISQIWKGLFLFCLLLIIIKKERIPIWALLGFLFSAKYLIYIYFPYGLTQSVKDALEQAIFPAFLVFLYYRYKDLVNNDYQYKLVRFSLIMSIFFIYSSIPFIIGLEGLNPGTDLSRYGLDENNQTKGIFYHIAVSSQIYCSATLVILCCYYMFKKSVYTKLFYVITIVLGSYLVYASFTRTAWFIFILGLLFIFSYSNKVKYKIAGLILFGLLSISIYFFYLQNEAVQLRLKGGAVKYRENIELSLENVMKSRLPFVMVAINNLQSEGIAAILIGYGTKHGWDLFEEKTGMAISSHNRIMEILESSGFFGLLLYILFISKIYRKIWRKNKLNYKIKKLNFVGGYLFIAFLFSHGMPFWALIIFSPIFAVSIINNEKERKKKTALLQSESI